MPKYYIKIDKYKFIIDKPTYDDGIKSIIQNNKYSFKHNSVIRISERGFEAKTWISASINKYLLS